MIDTILNVSLIWYLSYLYHIKRKFLEKDGNFRFVFEEDSKAKKYLEITK